jgi:hypothetical protein
MDTPDNEFPQLIKHPGPVTNGLTGVGEVSVRLHFELSRFASVLTHKGLKDRRRVNVGLYLENVLPKSIDMNSCFLFSCGKLICEIRPSNFNLIYPIYSQHIL